MSEDPLPAVVSAPSDRRARVMLVGPQFRVTRQRGQAVESDLAPLATATVHPSSILRAPDEEARQVAREEFTADLRAVARAIS